MHGRLLRETSEKGKKQIGMREGVVKEARGAWREAFVPSHYSPSHSFFARSAFSCAAARGLRVRCDTEAEFVLYE